MQPHGIYFQASLERDSGEKLRLVASFVQLQQQSKNLQAPFMSIFRPQFTFLRAVPNRRIISSLNLNLFAKTMTTTSAEPPPVQPHPQTLPQQKKTRRKKKPTNTPLPDSTSTSTPILSSISQRLRSGDPPKKSKQSAKSGQNVKVSNSNKTPPKPKTEKEKTKTPPEKKTSKKKMADGRGQKVAPSQASGGIPSPTSSYLAGSDVPAQRLEIPQHLLVVIDLNGTILYRPNRAAPRRVIARPHASRFLQYCIDTFTVVIWSSARPDNVAAIVDAILPKEYQKKCVAIWGRDKFKLSQADFNARVQCYKRLSTVWSDPGIARSHPDGRVWNQSNTVLVDDSVEKGRSEPFNIIPIPEYMGDRNETTDMLPQVHDYLNQLSSHSNVSSYMKQMPFIARASPQGPRSVGYSAAMGSYQP